MRKPLLIIICLVLGLSALSATIGIDVLILPKFEVGELSGDFPGEAQYYYEAYVEGGDAYEVRGGMPGSLLYVKDGVALYVTGMGKVNAAASMAALLGDSRFDFSDAYILSTGCAGSVREYSVMGDVFIITAAIDYDLGHHADPREMTRDQETTWFRDVSYDYSAFKMLNPETTDRAYELTKDTVLSTTPKTVAAMSAAFDGADWALRQPKVLKGTTVSGDNYWKGAFDEANAKLQAESYGAPDPYSLTEMEDVAIAVVLDRYGLLDNYLIIRDSVNMDVFMSGVTPESLWDPDYEAQLSDEDSVESADIFLTAMKNNFLVGSKVVDAILDGTF